MSSHPDLYKKLIDDDGNDVVVDDIEEQKNLLSKTAQARRHGVATRSRSGVPCWCKCIMITMALFTAFGIMVSVVTYIWMKDVVQHLTVTTPHERFPVVDMTDAQLTVVQDRIELFVDELIAGNHPASPLVVTQDEINGFLGHSDYLRGNMFVTLTENSIHEDYSLPVWMLPGGSDRYFVGEDHLTLLKDGHLEVSMETAAKHHDWFDGPLLFAQLQYLVKNHNNKDGSNTRLWELYLEQGSVFGQAAPADFIAQRENLLESLYIDADCEDAKAVLESIEGVSLEAGQIVIRAHQQEEQHVPLN